MGMEVVEEVQCVQPVGPAALDGERNERQRSVPNPTPTTTTQPKQPHLLELNIYITTLFALLAHVKTSNLAL